MAEVMRRDTRDSASQAKSGTKDFLSLFKYCFWKISVAKLKINYFLLLL